MSEKSRSRFNVIFALHHRCLPLIADDLVKAKCKIFEKKQMIFPFDFSKISHLALATRCNDGLKRLQLSGHVKCWSKRKVQVVPYNLVQRLTTISIDYWES